MNRFPDPNAYAANRLFCLDLMRGLVILMLTVLGHVLRLGIFKVWKPSEGVNTFFTHQLSSFAAPGTVPTGWGIWDFAQPTFIFVTGAAVTFAMRGRMDENGRPLPGFWKHLFSRFAMLWVLGMLIRGVLTFSLKKDFFFYADTLQTIAVAYLGATLAQLLPKRVTRLVIALAAILVFALIQGFCGDYTRLGNVSRIIDEAVFGALGGHGKDFCYLLTTIPWMAMGVLGSLEASILREEKGPWAKVAKLAGWGFASLVVGWILEIWIPPIRYIYTVSFIFVTHGYATLLLAALYILTDIWKLRRGTGFFLLFGQCSLAAWMLSTFFQGVLGPIVSRITAGVPKLIGQSVYLPLISEFVFACVFVALLSLWYRLRTAERAVARSAS